MIKTNLKNHIGVSVTTSTLRRVLFQQGTEGSGPAADSRTPGHFRGSSPQDAALRGVVEALVRIQAYMLATTTTTTTTTA
jgi:hypothetical protein